MIALTVTAYGPESRPPMAIFELLDYIVNEVSERREVPKRHCVCGLVVCVCGLVVCVCGLVVCVRGLVG